MLKKFLAVTSFASAALVVLTLPASGQPIGAESPTDAVPSLPVPRAVLERYVGRYELNGAIATVSLTDNDRLIVQLTGQPLGPPLRTVSTNEFAVDSIGARLFFEGEGPKAPRIRSRYAGSEVVGTRIADASAVPQPVSPQLGPARTALNAAARKDAVIILSSALRQRYVFPDIGERAASRIDAALAAGEYDSLTDQTAFAARLDADVSAIAHDKHFRITSMSVPPPARPAGGAVMPRAEAGVVRADKLAGGIGYIEVVGFPPSQSFKPAIDRAISSLAGSKALIIDVRRNFGGWPASVAYLVSFVLPPNQSVHINDIVSRVAGTNDFTRETFLSQPTPVSFAGRPLYVLTSKNTFSGGEEFAYDVQTLGRGVLVGELTGGGANPTGPVQLGNGLIASVPSGRAENPITKTNWEGRGVNPEVAVPAAEALKVALARLGHPAMLDIAEASQDQVFRPRSTPLPGTEAAVRSLVAGVTSGMPDYASMTTEFADVMRAQLPGLKERFASLGGLKSVNFREVDMMGGDAYDLVFVNGALSMAVVLGSDGKIVAGILGPPTSAGK